MSNNQLSETEQKEIQGILLEISTTTLSLLKSKNFDIKSLDDIVHKIYLFTLEKNGPITRTLRDKVFRYLMALHESIENVHAIHSHRTPISLKAYCEIFIYIFPVIYAPTIIFSIGDNSSQWVIYFIVLLTQFILISLYNIQNQLEYPFDDVGMDDINLDSFKIER